MKRFVTQSFFPVFRLAADPFVFVESLEDDFAVGRRKRPNFQKFVENIGKKCAASEARRKGAESCKSQHVKTFHENLAG